MNPQQRKSNLDLCVLALLSKSDMYGYELVNRISDAVSVSEGTIYPLLKRIKDEGLVTTYLKESNEGPPRKYYAITDIGLRRKDVLKNEFVAYVKGMNAILEGAEIL
ncbi:MAG: PadR family transcriptional regulator [Defluviitaleaceae bacterium]|nr:PadR family transcriptional regulator [Defluviitaleaceae bacterium]